MIRQLYSFALFCLFISAPTTWAEVETALHGFASIGISCSKNTEADFVYDTHPSGPGRTRRCDAGTDSVLSIQGDATLSETMTGALQITSQRSAWNNFVPTVTNANLRWNSSDNLSFRFGRVNTPLLIYSDHRLVHFAQPSIRPPPRSIWSGPKLCAGRSRCKLPTGIE